MQSRNSAQYWKSLPPVWSSDQDNLLVCYRIRQESHDVRSFFFRPLNAGLFRYLPGQFITLELTIAGETVYRSYTISSAPTRPDELSITVKRKPGGVVSNWLHDNLKVGNRIPVSGPLGDFSCSRHAAEQYLFLSGGVGITPLMSMARALHDLGEDRDVVFLHCARTPDDIAFRRELELMANQSGFRPAFICENADTEPGMPTGRLSPELLRGIAPDFLQRETFCCGPEPYMAAVRTMLADAGFDMQRYHEESFSFTDAPATGQPNASTSEAAEAASGFSVQLSKSGTTISCAPDQFILDAALGAGLRLPAACSKGVCGTCKSRMTSGQVDMKHGGGIRQREIDQGMVLLCCSKPLSDVTIER